MQANRAVMVQPSGGGMPRIGNEVTMEGLGAGGLAAAPPAPVAGRLSVTPPPKVPNPVFPVFPNVDAPTVGVDGEVVVAAGPAPVFDVTPDALAAAWARPKVR